MFVEDILALYQLDSQAEAFSKTKSAKNNVVERF